jgi:hypothetical protein
MKIFINSVITHLQDSKCGIPKFEIYSYKIILPRKVILNKLKELFQIVQKKVSNYNKTRMKAKKALKCKTFKLECLMGYK